MNYPETVPKLTVQDAREPLTKPGNGAGNKPKGLGHE